MNFCKDQFDVLALDRETKDLYDIHTNFILENNNLAGVKAIGKWLQDNSHDFFARPYYEEAYDVDIDAFLPTIIGYELLFEDAPFKAVSIDFFGKFPNIKSYQCNIALLISKKQITFFYSILQYLEKDWDNRILDTTKIQWTYTNAKIVSNESIISGLKSIYLSINNRIKSDITIQFGLKIDEKETDDLPF